MLYLAKFITCSGLFFVAYLLLLEKEKFHVFKRYYLLGSLLLSLAIPLITFESTTAAVPLASIPYLNIHAVEPNGQQQMAPLAQENTAIIPYLMLSLYLVVTLVLFARFIRHLFCLTKYIKQSKKEGWNGTTLILGDKSNAPYSFINYIFVSKSDYEQGRIAPAILQHEWAHVDQKHSIDVIFVELLKVFLWFNPLLYFYHKAIQTNHEYLADAHVIQQHQDVGAYQLLLIQQISKQSGLALVSPFNYLTIKKRLLMMNSANATKKAMLKQLLLLPILGMAIALFSTRTFAQPNGTRLSTEFTPVSFDGISEAEFDELQAILVKYKLQKKQDHQVFFAVRLAKPDENRLFELYHKMSAPQLKKLGGTIRYIEPALSAVPTKKQLEKWLDAKKYGVWINEKRIANADLAKFKATDFSLWGEYKLSPKAVNYGNHYYQVDLTTNAEYQAYLKKAMQHKLVVVSYKNQDLKLHSKL